MRLILTLSFTNRILSAGHVFSSRVINGQNAHFPFVVGLLKCENESTASECKLLCTGSLIAPSVVLTAGHCLEWPGEPGEGPQLSNPLETLRIHVANGNLYKVDRYSSRGVWLNLRFPYDNDLALMHLAEPIPVTAGVVETVKLNVYPQASACGSTIIFPGYGRNTNLESVFDAKNDEIRLRSTTSRIMATASCKQLYADERASKTFLPVPDKIDLWKSYIVEDTFFCATGEGGACFRDSGSPAVIRQMDGSFAVVGVLSFGSSTGVAQFCGAGPDYFQRISGHTDWLVSQKLGADSFTEWPVSQASYSEEFLATRGELKAEPEPVGRLTQVMRKPGRANHRIEREDSFRSLSECSKAASDAVKIISEFRTRSLVDFHDKTFDMAPMNKACNALERCDKRLIDTEEDLDTICLFTMEYRYFVRDKARFAQKIGQEHYNDDCKLDHPQSPESLTSDPTSLWLLVVVALLLAVLFVI